MATIELSFGAKKSIYSNLYLKDSLDSFKDFYNINFQSKKDAQLHSLNIVFNNEKNKTAFLDDIKHDYYLMLPVFGEDDTLVKAYKNILEHFSYL